LKNVGELSFGPDAQGQRGNDLQIFVSHGRADKHRGRSGARATHPVLENDNAGKRNRHGRLAIERSRQEGLVLWHRLIDQFTAEGADDPQLLVGHDIADKVVGRHARFQLFCEPSAQLGEIGLALRGRGTIGIALSAVICRQELRHDLANLLVVGQRQRTRLLHFKPFFEHRPLDGQQRLQFRSQVILHRLLDRPADGVPDDCQQQNGEYGPNPQLLLEQQTRPRERASKRRLAERHVGLNLIATIARTSKKLGESSPHER
jgi:hypothetical protein